MKRVIIVGSPRSNGRSGHLAEMLFEANIDERPEDELFLVPVSEVEIGPCIGCNACRAKTPVIYKGDDGEEVSEERYRCVFDDDMQTLYDLLDEADALTIVTPIFFSGAPAPMKCVLDRLQPYFWSYVNEGPRLPKRPLELHVVGEGGDPHGYDALVSEVKSATQLAGFRIARILDWVGKIDADGEIAAEAVEVDPAAYGIASDIPAAVGEADADAQGAEGRTEARSSTSQAAEARQSAKVQTGNSAAAGSGAKDQGGKPRPKLDLSKSGLGGKAKGRPQGKGGGAKAGRQSNSPGKGDARSKNSRPQGKQGVGAHKHQGGRAAQGKGKGGGRG